MRADVSGIKRYEEGHAREGTEGVGEPVERIGTAAVGGGELVDFIDGAEDDEREDGEADEFFPRPIEGPSEGRAERHAPGGERGEVLRLIPDRDAQTLDLGPGERGEIGDGAGPGRDREPCSDAE